MDEQMRNLEIRMRAIAQEELRTALTPVYFIAEGEDPAWALTIIANYVQRALMFHTADHHTPRYRSRFHRVWEAWLGPVVMITFLIAVGIMIGLTIGRAL